MQQTKNFGRIHRSLMFIGSPVADLPRGVSRCFLNKKRGDRGLCIASQVRVRPVLEIEACEDRIGSEGPWPGPPLSSALLSSPQLLICTAGREEVRAGLDGGQALQSHLHLLSMGKWV